MGHIGTPEGWIGNMTWHDRCQCLKICQDNTSDGVLCSWFASSGEDPMQHPHKPSTSTDPHPKFAASLVLWFSASVMLLLLGWSYWWTGRRRLGGLGGHFLK